MNKPQHQSQVAKQTAQAVIDRKLGVLREWIAHGIPYREDNSGHVLVDAQDRKVLEFFPTSLRQFKQWDGSQNSPRLRTQLPTLTVTGNDTLAKRPAQEEQAKRIIEALMMRARSQLDAGRASTVRKLEQELRLAHHTIGLRVAELREQQRTLRQLEREHARLSAQHEGDAAEFKKVLDQTNTALAQERQRNAELAGLLSKVSPLRRSIRGT